MVFHNHRICDMVQCPKLSCFNSTWWVVSFLHAEAKKVLTKCTQRYPDLGYVSYFWGIDSANNHSHISKPHPLNNNTDTLGGRFPWLVIQPLINIIGFWNISPIFLPIHEHHLWCALPEGVGNPFFSTVLLSMRSLIWALLGSGNKDAGESGAVVFWQFPANPQRGGQLFH
jgi:hypothetical protein